MLFLNRNGLAKSEVPLTGKVSKVFLACLITGAIAITPQSLLSQALQIKREVAFGRTDADLGTHRVMVNSSGEVITLSKHSFDTSNLNQWLVSRFTKQLVPGYATVTTLNAMRLDINAFIESADKGYVIVGSGEIRKVLNGPVNYDVRVDKMLSDGSFRFDKSFGGNGDDKGIGIQQLADGGYLVIANSLSTDQDIQNLTGKSQVWLAKIDANGDKVWGKLLTNSHAHEATDFIKTPDGNFAICGSVKAEVSLGANAGTGEAFIMKFKEDGTMIWQTYTGGTSEDDRFNRMISDPAGGFILVGSSKSSFGAGAINHGGTDGWIAKANQQGGVFFNKLIGGSGEDSLKAVTISASGIITAGGSTRSKDGDISDNVYEHTIWITRLSDDNTQSSQGYFGHPVDDASSIEDLATGPDGSIYCTANSNAGNPLLSRPIGKTDGWLFTLGEKNIFTGSVFIDMNNNGIKDANESLFTGGKFEVTKPGNPAANEFVLSHAGKFETWLDTGSYNARFVTDRLYYNVVPQDVSFTFPDYNLTKDVMITMTPAPGKNDLAVDIIPHSIPRPGFGVNYTVRYRNQGTTPISNITVKFVKDIHVGISRALPSASFTSGDTLSWSIGTLNPLDSGSVYISGWVQAPPTTSLGDTLITKAIITPDANDETRDNNTMILAEVAQGSYDPNDKTEFHGGVLPASGLSNERLTYLIRFQNTGTDTAFNIFIRDTLNAQIDPSTIQMISASHPFTLNVRNSNELEWKFKNILLPDSNVNEKASHGYILFTVKPKTSLVVGDVISNRASIYFDFNLPLATNITSTRIIDLSLPRPVISGLKTTYCGADGDQAVLISNIALAGSATVTIKLNNTILAPDINGKFIIKPGSLSVGQQTLSIAFTLNGASSSLTTQFQITGAVTPDVTVTSNFSAVTNNLTAILLTATAASGAGPTPLYSFASDRSFSNILRQEGVSNVLALTSGILKAGDNWLYVKMKTSESCYRTATAIDSVKIVRIALITSVTDIDYPGTQITAYPNPFGPTLTIKGLQPSVSYSIHIIDAVGKTVAVQEVQNTTVFTFSSLQLANGKYFVRLYDRKKQRLIGSMPLMKL